MRKSLWLVAGVLVALSLAGGGIAWALGAPSRVVYFEHEDFSLSQEQKASLDELVPLVEEAERVQIDGYV